MDSKTAVYYLEGKIVNKAVFDAFKSKLSVSKSFADVEKKGGSGCMFIAKDKNGNKYHYYAGSENGKAVYRITAYKQ